jgi:hypothetical protein
VGESSFPEKQQFVHVDVTGKNAALWTSLRPKLIQALDDISDTVIDNERGMTVRDEMKTLTTALLDYAKANLARPGFDNETLEAEVRRLYGQLEIDRAEARKKQAEADVLEFNNKVKRLRLALGMAKALLIGDTTEEAVIFAEQIDAFLKELDPLVTSDVSQAEPQQPDAFHERLESLEVSNTQRKPQQPAVALPLTFTIGIDPGDASVEDLQRLFSALSELYRTFGGEGLIFKEDDSQVYSFQETYQ